MSSYPPPPPPPGSAGSFEPRPGQYPQPGPYPQPGAPGAYPVPQGAAQQPNRLRGRTPLRLAIIFLVVGLAAIITGAALLESKAYGKVKGFARVSISNGEGTGTVHLAAGKYVAYYEAPGADGLTKNIPLPGIALQSPSGQTTVLTTLYGGGDVHTSNKIKSRLTYSTNGHDGIAIYQFKISQTGDYQVLVRSDAAKTNSDVAFGPSIAKSTAISVVIAVLGALLFVAGVVLLIVGLVKRHNHKKELKSGAFAGYPPPGQYPPPGGQYPPPPPPAPNANPGSMYDEQFRPPQ